jgi:hypothetical protein
MMRFGRVEGNKSPIIRSACAGSLAPIPVLSGMRADQSEDHQRNVTNVWRACRGRAMDFGATISGGQRSEVEESKCERIEYSKKIYKLHVLHMSHRTSH